MRMCEHDNWAHGIRPFLAGTPLECPYRTTEQWRFRKLGLPITLPALIRGFQRIGPDGIPVRRIRN